MMKKTAMKKKRQWWRKGRRWQKDNSDDEPEINDTSTLCRGTVVFAAYMVPSSYENWVMVKIISEFILMVMKIILPMDCKGQTRGGVIIWYWSTLSSLIEYHWKDHMGSGYEGWSEGLGGVVDGDKSGFHLDAVSRDQHCPLYQIAYHWKEHMGSRHEGSSHHSLFPTCIPCTETSPPWVGKLHQVGMQLFSQTCPI